jgi:iron complex transport system permease protein
MCVGSSGWNTGAWHFQHPFFALRCSRVVLGFCTGAGLACCGCVLQALYRNPLAEPYTLGVSGGCALGGAAAIVLGFTHPYALPLCAFAGALLSTWGTFALNQRLSTRDTSTLLLIGVLLNIFASAWITWIKTMVTATQAQTLLYWLTGSIGSEPWHVVAWVVGVSCISYTLLRMHALSLNTMVLGEHKALSLGVPVKTVCVWVVCATSLWIGTLVSFCGMVSFVGLVVPHLVRHTWGFPVHRILLPTTLLGGLAVVLADALSRLSMHVLGTEIPVGAMTAVLGVPFTVGLLWVKPNTR